jgi:hypothetical protein
VEQFTTHDVGLMLVWGVSLFLFFMGFHSGGQR